MRASVWGMLTVAVGSGAMYPMAAQEANPSHVHIRHAADAFRGTPDGMGLLPAARAEAEVAARHAGLAAEAENLAGIQAHLGHVIHALDPTAVDAGPGRGYGLIQAAQGAARHIQLAANAEGASENVRLHATHVAASATNAAEWSAQALERARAGQAATDATAAAAAAHDVRRLVGWIGDGYDANDDGRVGWQPGEGGLAQAALHLGLMKRGEGMEAGSR